MSVAAVYRDSLDAGGGVGNIKLSNYLVDAGNDRLLVVETGVSGGTVTGITYGTDALTRVASQTGGGVEADIWALPLGSGTSSTTRDLVVTSSGYQVGGYLAAMPYTGVNQAAPIGASGQQIVAAGAGSLSQELASRPGDLLVDNLTLAYQGSLPTLNPGIRQGINGGGGATLVSGMSSQEAGASPGASLSWTFGPAPSINGGSYVAVDIQSTAQPATVTVSDSGTYDGTPHPATGSAVGADGTTPVSGSFLYTYYTARRPTPHISWRVPRSTPAPTRWWPTSPAPTPTI